MKRHVQGGCPTCLAGCARHTHSLPHDNRSCNMHGKEELNTADIDFFIPPFYSIFQPGMTDLSTSSFIMSVRGGGQTSDVSLKFWIVQGDA